MPQFVQRCHHMLMRRVTANKRAKTERKQCRRVWGYIQSYQSVAPRSASDHTDLAAHTIDDTLRFGCCFNCVCAVIVSAHKISVFSWVYNIYNFFSRFGRSKVRYSKCTSECEKEKKTENHVISINWIGPRLVVWYKIYLNPSII